MPDPSNDKIQQTLDHLIDVVPGNDAAEFAITELDVTGVPVWSVTNWQDDGEMINGIGYGPTDVRARVGAWAELLEQTASHTGAEHFERRRASYTQLLREAGPDEEVVDPRRLRLPAGTPWTPEMEITWVAVRRYRAGVAYDDQPRAWVPIEAAATHTYDLRLNDGEQPLYQPVSNGNGAGDTDDRALCHGLLELVQRDGNSAGYRAADRHIRIELDDVRDRQTRALLDRLDAAGIEVIAKLADTNLGMTNLYVVGHERDPDAAPHPIVLSGCGEAAHPDREAALQKALLEFCASRVRKLFTHGPLDAMEHLFPDGYLDRFRANPASVEESRSFDDVRRLAHMPADEVMTLMGKDVFRVDETVKFSELPTVDPASVDGVETLLAETVRRFDREGLPIYWVRLLSGDGHAACKAIVPEMEVETLTYYRIGRRNLDRLVQRGVDYVGYGHPPSAASGGRPTAEPVLLPDGAPAWMDRAAVDATVGDAYCLYREPEVHAVALAELQTA